MVNNQKNSILLFYNLRKQKFLAPSLYYKPMEFTKNITKDIIVAKEKSAILDQVTNLYRMVHFVKSSHVI